MGDQVPGTVGVPRLSMKMSQPETPSSEGYGS
uniref:Uncharacterized protein n=1 Tax=Trichinella nativa TaxID=6335 RepID=A0A0V1KIS5_9BILA